MQVNSRFTFIQQCTGNGEGHPEPCPSTKPYCVFDDTSNSTTAKEGAKPGKCSATKSDKSYLTQTTTDVVCPADQATPSFTCTALNFFPDPVNCQKYYECSLTNTKILNEGSTTEYTYKLVRQPKEKSCRPEYAYNALTQACDLRYYPGRCPQIICNESDLYKYKYYGTSKQYFGLCVKSATGGYKPTMYSCPDNTLANISQIPFSCDYACRRIGFFTHSMDSSKYFECYISNGRFRSEELQCEEGKIFQQDRNVLKWNCIFP